MPEVNCITCSVDITTSRTRRLLMTPSSKHIDGVVAEVLEKVIPVGRRINTGLLRNCYICRLCFRSMEKIMKLRDDAIKSFQELCDNAKSAVRFLPLVESDLEVIDQPPPAKRQRLLTSDLSCTTSTESSPTVAVSFKCNA